MRKIPYLRAGVVGLALLIVSDASADGLNLFRRHLQADCPQEVIRLPAREIVVETARPRVTVHEARLRERAFRGGHALFAPAPVVATFFTPMNLRGDFETGDVRFRESGPFRAARDLEDQLLAYRKVQAAYRVDLAAAEEAERRVMTSMRAAAEKTEPCCKTPATTVEAQIKDLSNRLDSLSSRVEDLQKMTLFNNEVIRKEVLKNVPPKP